MELAEVRIVFFRENEHLVYLVWSLQNSQLFGPQP